MRWYWPLAGAVRTTANGRKWPAGPSRASAAAAFDTSARGAISGQRCAPRRRAYPRQVAAPSKPNPAKVATATQGLIRRITATS